VVRRLDPATLLLDSGTNLPQDRAPLLRGYLSLFLCSRIASVRGSHDRRLLDEIRHICEEALSFLTSSPINTSPPSLSSIEFFGRRVPFPQDVCTATEGVLDSPLLAPLPDQRFVVIVGHLCSGKDTVAELFHEHCRAVLVAYSQLLKPILGILGITSPRRADYQVTGDAVRGTFGADILSLLMVNLLRHERDPILCIGPRFKEEVVALRGCTVVGIRTAHDDPEDGVEERFLRYTGRGRDGDVPQRDQFMARELEERPTIGEIFASGLVDYWLHNGTEASPTDLRGQVASLVATLERLGMCTRHLEH
jgi:hypothetical protein